VNWVDNPQPNGNGLLSECGNYAIRQCKYENGQPTEYYCYYKPKKHEMKFMRIPDGVRMTLSEAKENCEAFKRGEHVLV